MSRAIVAVTIAVTVAGTLSVTVPAQAYENHYNWWQKQECRMSRNGHWSNSEIRDLIRCAFIRLKEPGQIHQALYVAGRESGYQERAYNPTGCGGPAYSGCKGLFQWGGYWPWGHYPKMNRRFNLPYDPFNPRSNSFITARVVKGGGWGPWS